MFKTSQSPNHIISIPENRLISRSIVTDISYDYDNKRMQHTVNPNINTSKTSGGRLKLKMPSYQYKDSHVKNKTVLPTAASLTWEFPYMGKTVLYWDGAQISHPNGQSIGCPSRASKYCVIRWLNCIWCGYRHLQYHLIIAYLIYDIWNCPYDWLFPSESHFIWLGLQGQYIIPRRLTIKCCSIQ